MSVVMLHIRRHIHPYPPDGKLNWEAPHSKLFGSQRNQQDTFTYDVHVEFNFHTRMNIGSQHLPSSTHICAQARANLHTRSNPSKWFLDLALVILTGNTEKRQRFRIVLVFSTPATGGVWVDWTSPSFQMLTDTAYTATWPSQMFGHCSFLRIVFVLLCLCSLDT